MRPWAHPCLALGPGHCAQQWRTGDKAKRPLPLCPTGRQQARRPNPATSAQRQAPQPAAAAVQQRPLMKRKREHAAAAEEGSTAPVAVNLLDARADGAGQGTRQAGPGPAPAAPSPAAPSAAAALPAHVGDPWVALDRIKPLLRAVGVTAKEASGAAQRSVARIRAATALPPVLSCCAASPHCLVKPPAGPPLPAAGE